MQDTQLILNRYRPISEAGSGGFATVQLAWDTRIQRRVAIKCIQLDDRDIAIGPQGVPVAAATTPGLEEARTAALLSDGNIVGVYDFEVQGDQAYLIMEYVDGMTLTALMRRFGAQLSLDVMAAVFTSVAHALEVAHDNQVLHLDIKPDNVLINQQGQVKVTDFGLATLSDATGFGQAGGGTIGYMPPEQMGLSNLDARCDEWALASLTYEMITGVNPFLAPDLAAAEAIIESAELVLPSLCREGLAPDIDDVLFYALDPNREERYDTVGDFAEEIEPFLGSPARGHKQLAVLVGQACEDFEQKEEEPPREFVSFFDRFSIPAMGTLARLGSVVGVGATSFVGLVNIFHTDWTNPLLWGLWVLFVVAAALKPHLGSLFALSSLGVALVMNQAYIVGILLVISSVLWWFFVGRYGHAQANTALAPVVLGAFGGSQTTPLLAGFFLSVKDAAITAVFAAFLALVLAGFGSSSLVGWNVQTYWNFQAIDVQANILGLLQEPLNWCIVASWILSSTVMSLFCHHQTRLFAFFGMLVSAAILISALCLGAWLSSAQTTWIPSMYVLIPTIASIVIMIIATTLGVPPRFSPDEVE